MRAIEGYIPADNAAEAERWVGRLIPKAEAAAKLPVAGRLVREKRRADIPEVFLRTYRIVYRVREGSILARTVFEGRRLFPSEAMDPAHEYIRATFPLRRYPRAAMHRRVLARTILALILLAACGERSDPTEKSAEATVTPASSGTTAMSSSAPAPSASAAETPKPVAIGPWRKSFGGPLDDYLRGLAIGPNGATTIVGRFERQIDLGGGPLTNASEYINGFVASFDATGKHIWSRKDMGYQAFAVAQDPAGNVVVTGSLGNHGSFDLGGGPIGMKTGGLSGSFIVKYDAKGTYAWHKVFVDAEAENVAVDREGNLIVAGTFSSKIDFGGGPLVATGMSMAGKLQFAFVVKLDPAGNHLFSKSFGTHTTTVSGLSVDAGGNVVATGRVMGPVDFGAGPLGGASYNIWVTKLSPSGANLWGKAFTGGTQYGDPTVAVDAAGGVVLGGAFNGGNGLDVGGGKLAQQGGETEAFLAKFGPDGAHVWSKSLGSKGRDTVAKVAIDKSGTIAVLGDTDDAADLGGGPLPVVDKASAFLARFDASGAHISSKRFGQYPANWSSILAFDEAGTPPRGGRLRGVQQTRWRSSAHLCGQR